MSDAIIHIPAGVRGAGVPRRPLARCASTRLFKHPQTRVVPLDTRTAFVVGLLLGRRGGSDVVDASVVLCARTHGQGVVTSDPDDLRRLDPDLPLEVV